MHEIRAFSAPVRCIAYNDVPRAIVTCDAKGGIDYWRDGSGVSQDGPDQDDEEEGSATLSATQSRQQ